MPTTTASRPAKPTRVLNVLLYPTPHSIMFRDMVSLRGYLLLNPVIALVTLRAEREDRTPPRWIKPIILLSIPWAVSIHTVTAFLYNGLPGRSLWLTAILPRDFWPRLSRPLGTLVTSIVGVAIFEILARTQLSAGAAVRPD